MSAATMSACDRLLEAFSAGEPLDEAHRAHASSCAACALLIDALATKPVELAPSEDALARWKHASVDELQRRPRARRWWTDVLWLIGANVTIAALAVAAHSERGLVSNPMPPALLWSFAAALLALMVGGGWLALAPSSGRSKLSTSIGISLAFATGAALVVSGGVLSGSAPFALAPDCLAFELLGSLPAMAVTVWFLQRMAYSLDRALLASLAAGAVGLFALHLQCPDVTALHLLHAHVAPWIAVAAIAVWVRSRIPTYSHAP